MILAELDCLSLCPLSCCLLIKTGQNICVWLLSLSHLLSCLVIFCDHYFQWAGAMQSVDLALPSNTSLQMWSSALVFCTPLVYECGEGRQGFATQSPWKWYFGTGSEVKKTPEVLPTSQMFYSYLPIYYVFLLCTSFLFWKKTKHKGPTSFNLLPACSIFSLLRSFIEHFQLLPGLFVIVFLLLLTDSCLLHLCFPCICQYPWCFLLPYCWFMLITITTCLAIVYMKVFNISLRQ